MESNSHLLKVGEFVLNTNSRKLFDQNNREVLLSPTLYALLKFFIDHQNEILTKEAIIGHVWKGKIVVEANVNQNIKKLRDTLGDSVAEPKYIETVTGEGFRFIANSEAYKASPNKVTQSKTLIYSSVGFVLSILIAVPAIFSFYDFNKSTLKEIYPLTTLRGIEHYPFVHEEKNVIVFSHKVDIGDTKGDWNIFLRPLERESYHLILGSEYNETFPVLSPSGDFLMYHAYGKVNDVSKCGLFVKSINLTNFQTGVEKKLVDCENNYQRIRGEWKSEDVIFVSINENLISPASIYQINITTKERKLISKPDSKGFGDYAFKFSPKLNKLAYVRNIGWTSSEIWIYDVDSETHERIKSIPMMIRGLDWQEEWLYFQSGSRVISRISVDGKEETVATLLSNIYLPFSIDEERVGVVQGEMKIVDINKVELSSKKEEKAVSSSFNDYEGVRFLENEVVFVSNRTGDPQVWLKDQLGDFNQLTFFSDAYEIKWLTTFPELELIMFNKSGTTIIINRKGEVIFDSEDYSNQVHNNSVFDTKNKRILYSKQYRGEWNIEYRNLEALGENQMLFEGKTAKACFTGNCILYFKEGDQYLYSYNSTNNFSTKLVDVGPIQRASQWEVVDDQNIIYLEENGIRNNIIKLNFVTGEKAILHQTKARAFSYSSNKNEILVSLISQGDTDLTYFLTD